MHPKQPFRAVNTDSTATIQHQASPSLKQSVAYVIVHNCLYTSPSLSSCCGGAVDLRQSKALDQILSLMHAHLLSH